MIADFTLKVLSVPYVYVLSMPYIRRYIIFYS